MTARGFALFETAIGRCGIAWAERGVVGIQLPEASEARTLARMRRRFPDAIEAPPPPVVMRAIEGIVALLQGEAIDLSAVALDLAIVPQLATAWKPLDPTTWEFKLRPGVTIHDGTPFTAADVLFSIERARAETSDFRGYVDGIAAVEAIDDHTIRFATTAPDPLLWLKLADVSIMSRAWAEQHGVTKPADYFGRREDTYASRHANGTGPFVVEVFEPRGDWVVIRNPDWWGASDYPDRNIDRVLHIRKEDDAEKVAALLDGEIDLLQMPPY